MRSLYWLRSDLRFHDNSALNDFLRSSSEGAFLYCLPYNFDQLSSFRQMFLKETLDDFSAKLSVHGFQLYIIPYSLHQTIPDLMVRHQIECLFYTREYTSYELRDEKRLKLKLDSLSIQIKDYDQQTLIHEKDLPFVLGKMPMAFGEFRKKIESDIIIKSPLEMAPFQLSPLELDLPSFIIEANMKELNQTGWMSNRGRQNVASYLAKTLHLDWRQGAQYFEEMLIDYDPSSNWGNWNYVAGVRTDPRDRIFSPERQAQNYDPHNLYQDLWS